MRSFRVTKTAWFGPRRWLGWGWAIKSWRGLLVTVVFVGLNAAVTFWRPGPASRVWSLVATHVTLAVLFLVVVVLTGDPPGWRRSAR